MINQTHPKQRIITELQSIVKAPCRCTVYAMHFWMHHAVHCREAQFKCIAEKFCRKMHFCTFAMDTASPLSTFLQWCTFQSSAQCSVLPVQWKSNAVYYQCSVSQVQCINNSLVYDECSGASFGADAVLSWGKDSAVALLHTTFSYHQRWISIFLIFALKKY